VLDKSGYAEHRDRAGARRARADGQLLTLRSDASQVEGAVKRAASDTIFDAAEITRHDSYYPVAADASLTAAFSNLSMAFTSVADALPHERSSDRTAAADSRSAQYGHRSRNGVGGILTDRVSREKRLSSRLTVVRCRARNAGAN